MNAFEQAGLAFLLGTPATAAIAHLGTLAFEFVGVPALGRVRVLPVAGVVLVAALAGIRLRRRGK